MPGTPCSASDGTPGAAGERLACVTASARSWPDWINGASVGQVPNSIGTCPPITSSSACVVPLYGTCSSVMPALCRNSSPARCSPLPTPGLA